MRVVSNTSPLIAFAKIDLFQLLHQLFGVITISETVAYEFLDNCTKEEKTRFLLARKQYLEVVTVKNILSFSRKLGRGEQEILTLALQKSTDLLLMDDRKGRNEAEERYLIVASTRAILRIAEERRLIPSYKAVEDVLHQQHFFVPNY